MPESLGATLAGSSSMHRCATRSRTSGLTILVGWLRTAVTGVRFAVRVLVGLQQRPGGVSATTPPQAQHPRPAAPCTLQLPGG